MALAVTPEEAKKRLLHILDIFPAISPSMINIALSWQESTTWRPVLNEMLEQGVLKLKTIYVETPAGRNKSYQVIYNPNRFDYNTFAETVKHQHRVQIDLSNVSDLEEDTETELPTQETVDTD